jgi:sugar lactone lactonase YvrE
VATIAIVVADDLDFPNGMVITPDRPLIVAESTGRRLSAFTIGGPGDPAVAVGRRHGCHPRRRPALVRKAHQ